MCHSMEENCEDCQSVAPCEPQQQSSSTTASSSTSASTMSSSLATSSNVNGSKSHHRAYILSLDGVNLTQAAVDMINAQHSSAPSAANGDENIIHRKLLRRRHVRKLQKERAQSLSARHSRAAIFGEQHFAFLDMKLPKRQPPPREVSSPCQQVVRYMVVGHPKPPTSPIVTQPRMVVNPIWPCHESSVEEDESSLVMMPPMSPIHVMEKTTSLPTRLGIKRKLDGSFV